MTGWPQWQMNDACTLALLLAADQARSVGHVTQVRLQLWRRLHGWRVTMQPLHGSRVIVAVG